MKKTILSLVLVATFAVALGISGTVHAQSPTPQVPGTGTGYGNGMMGGRGGQMMGGNLGGNLGSNLAGSQDGLLHDELIAVYAVKLGISVDDLNARLAAGETMSTIAISEGLTIEEFRSLMTEVRATALDQAVKDGTLTQDQADWLKTRGARMGSGIGVRGSGQGLRGTGTCPYLQANS